jgi:hypothetical protein
LRQFKVQSLRFNGRTTLTIEREAAERLDFLFIFVGGIRLWLIPIPLGRMLITSFCSGHPTPGPFTVSNGLITYTNPLTYRMILGRKTNA